MILLIFNFIVFQFGISSMSKTIGASEKLVEYMKYVPDVNTEGGNFKDPKNTKGIIEFKNVSFSYPSKKEVMVMKNIDLVVE